MEATLKIRAGYDIAFKCFQKVPMLLMLSVHPSRQQDLLTEHAIRFSPNAEARDFRDAFGNVCTRLVAPPGLIEICNEFLIADSGLPDETNVQAEQWAVGDLPGSSSPGAATRPTSRSQRRSVRPLWHALPSSRTKSLMKRAEAVRWKRRRRRGPLNEEGRRPLRAR